MIDDSLCSRDCLSYAIFPLTIPLRGVARIPECVAAFFSPDGSLRVNDDPAAVGRNAITQVAQSFMTAFPDLSVMMDDLLLRGDVVEYHWTLMGTNTGPGGTGRRVRISGSEGGGLE